MPGSTPPQEDATDPRPGGSARRLPHVVGLTAEGRVALGLVLLVGGWGLLQGDALVLLLACVLLGLLWAARRAAARNLRGIEVDRQLPSRTRAGRPTQMGLVVRAPERGGARLGVEVEDRTAPGVQPDLLRVEIPQVGDEPVRAQIPLTLRRRGWIRLETLILSSRWPLGLARARRRVEAPARMLVHPREGRLTREGREVLFGGGRHEARVRQHTRGADHLHGLRRYRPGDDPRRIHWKHTARTGTVLLTQWRQEEGEAVVLSLGVRVGDGARAAGHFERAVSVVATLWRALPRSGRQARLVLDAQEVLEAQRPSALRLGLDRLARVDGHARRHPLGSSLASTSTRCRWIHVAAGDDPQEARALAALRARGVSVVALRADQPSLRRHVGGLG